MTRPWKHPATGIFWLRKAVPQELRTLVGKREEKCSLKTRDESEAKLRLARALVELEERWAQLRRATVAVSEREAHRIGLELQQIFIDRHASNPSQHNWNVDIGGFLDQPEALKIVPVTSPLHDRLPLFVTPAQERERLLEVCEQEISVYLKSKGLVVDAPSRVKLVRAAWRSLQKAGFTLDDYARGNYPSIASTPAPAPSLSLAVTNELKTSVSFDDIWNAWAKEARPAAKTLYSWKRVFLQFAEFLQPKNPMSTTTEDVIRWKDALVEGGLSSKTIRDGKLAPIRAILQWASDNQRIPNNPAARVLIDVRKKPSERKRSFSDAEAQLLLEASQNERAPARRWIPWLCAYSGARLAEISQLRKEDISEIEGVWCIRIAPEAGSLKNSNSERIIPIHSALVSTGFLSFVRAAPDGPFRKLRPTVLGAEVETRQRFFPSGSAPLV